MKREGTKKGGFLEAKWKPFFKFCLYIKECKNWIGLAVLGHWWCGVRDKLMLVQENRREIEVICTDHFFEGILLKIGINN